MADDDYRQSFGLASQLQVIAILILVVVLLWFHLRITRIENQPVKPKTEQPKAQDLESVVKPFMKDEAKWKTANEVLENLQE